MVKTILKANIVLCKETALVDGVAERSSVYHNGAAGKVESLVLLSDTTVLGLTTDITEAAGYVQIA